MGTSTLQEICDFAVEQGAILTQSEYGYLFFMNHDETVLTVHSWSESALKICDVEGHPTVYKVKNTGLWGEAARQRKPIITNVYKDSPYKRGIPCGHVPITRHMNIPVFDPDDEDEIVGVLGVGNKAGEYSDADAQKLMAFAQQAIEILQDHLD